MLVIISIIMLIVLITLLLTKNGVVKLLLLLLLPMSMKAYDIKSIMNTLKIVESGNNPYAIGDNGMAYGILQIHKGCVRDVNRHYGTNFKHSDAFNVNKAERIFRLYITMGYLRYKRKYNKNPTEYELVRMWNGGIYQGYRIKQTEKYLKKYLKHKWDEQRTIFNVPEGRYDENMVLVLPTKRWETTRVKIHNVFFQMDNYIHTIHVSNRNKINRKNKKGIFHRLKIFIMSLF